MTRYFWNYEVGIGNAIQVGNGSETIIVQLVPKSFKSVGNQFEANGMGSFTSTPSAPTPSGTS